MGNINFNYISANNFNDFNNFIFDLYRIFYIDIINHRCVLRHDFFSVRTNNRTDKIKLSNNRAWLLLRWHLNKDENCNRSPDIDTLIIFLTRRRRRAKERHNMPTPYDMATSQTTAVSTQELVVSPIHAALSPGPQTTTAAVPLSRTPVLNVPPSIDGQSRDPSPSPSSTRRMPVSQGPGPNDSSTEIGLAVAVSLDHRRSATEQELRSPSRGTVRLARMPFDNSYDPEDDAVSEASDSDGRRRDREFDEISDVSSFSAFSPTWDGGRRQYR
ncbi:uncharacterized protein N7446_001389 [Penicillium canescens]|uniref:Uncharacterized protein n=1 Tax=Penicillium canescens TaxID=5083 RepID=A0AAD6IC19_PENCN|nr:uncharacterized protein N7446_001389 [Penicillium canescens]KAJ6043193.1 hypothetical protein N7460_004548 [Penicillium canescens]KAJ6054668.1 hypothetical protein N7444_003766 [Penicillium canescens]KAJ6073612.1 hypothetical protein N7446_001389 [Penicillium canescens]